MFALHLRMFLCASLIILHCHNWRISIIKMFNNFDFLLKGSTKIFMSTSNPFTKLFLDEIAVELRDTASQFSSCMFFMV